MTWYHLVCSKQTRGKCLPAADNACGKYNQSMDVIPPQEIIKARKRLQGLSDSRLQQEIKSAEQMIAFWQRRLAGAIDHLAEYQRQLQQYLEQDIDNKDPLTKEVIEMIIDEDQESITEARIDLAWDQMNLQLCLQEQAGRQAVSADSEHR